MKHWREVRASVALLLAACVACPPSWALVTLNDSHDHLYITGTLGVAHDSNIFANSSADGDYVYNASLLAEYNRHAGWIGVNASVQLDASQFGSYRGENFNNPKFNAEFTKQTGRTKGSFTLSAARQSRADPAVNLRNESWNYAAGLGFKYPIIERYSVAGSVGYSLVDYVDNTLYVDLSSFSASADLFYIFSNERDLLAGYRYRFNQTSRETSTTDHSFTVGVTGRILKGINGSLRVGYQFRVPKGSSEDTYSAWTASGSATHSFSKKMDLTGTIGKDFSTTATNTNVDSLTASLDLQYTLNSRWNGHLGAGWGNTRFLGPTGIDPLSGQQRQDTNASLSAGIGFSLNEYLKMSLGYSWSENWSTIQQADFIRQGWSFSTSSHW